MVESGKGLYVCLFDKVTGRTVRVVAMGKESGMQKVLQARPVPYDKEGKVPKELIRKWRDRGYSDGQIFDRIALGDKSLRDYFMGGYDETQLVDLYLSRKD